MSNLIFPRALMEYPPPIQLFNFRLSAYSYTYSNYGLYVKSVKNIQGFLETIVWLQDLNH